MIPIVIGALGTITKGLVRGLEDLVIRGQVETIQITALLRSAKVLRKVLENEETCCLSNSGEKASANAGVKNTKRINKLQNMKVTVIPIVIGALGTTPKDLVRSEDKTRPSKIQH